jgi:predicted transport protein
MPISLAKNDADTACRQASAKYTPLRLPPLLGLPGLSSPSLYTQFGMASKKRYIAYKTTTNFVDIEPQLKRLRLSLNMKFSEINDPKGMCRDLTGIGHYTNGDVEISVTSLDQIDYAMDLIHQSFEKHWEEDDV